MHLSPAPFNPVELLRDESSHVRHLREQLRACQRRLGTADELWDDFDRARRLAHEINNWLTIEYLQAQLASGSGETHFLPHPAELMVA